MPIVETKTVIRPNTSVPFFVDSGNAVLEQTKIAIGYVLVERTATYTKTSAADGNIIGERTISEDGLTQTNVVTFASIADYNRVDTLISIALDNEYQQYAADNGFSHSENQFAQTGFVSPFTCTTTYNYNENTTTLYPLFDYFINCLEASDMLISMINNGSQVIAVHEYLNSEDFNANHWQDFAFVHGLHTGGVTRTIQYALV